MINLTREEAQRVLDCIIWSTEYKLGIPAYEQMEAFLCAKLSEPEPSVEPIPYKVGDATVYIKPPIYTAPPQREWVGLTHEEIAEESGAAKAQNHMVLTLAEGFFCGARWAESKLKEKNEN